MIKLSTFFADVKKCDARPEGCTQCDRAHRPCPGYREYVDLLFRDQNTEIIGKVKAREERKRLKRAAAPQDVMPWQRSDNFASQGHREVQPLQRAPLLKLLLNLKSPVEDRAMCYFMSRHIFGRHGAGQGLYDVLDSLKASATTSDLCLTSSLGAASLASYAHYTHDINLIDTSRVQYTQAIRFTKLALESEVDVRKDSTILSTILLGVFEQITGCTEESTKSASAHVRGAAELIRLRGSKQIQSKRGRRILFEVARAIICKCFERSIGIPDHLVDLIAHTPSDRQAPSQSASKAIIQLNSFIARIKTDGTHDSGYVVEKILELERPLAEICENPPPGWDIKPFYNTNPEASSIVFNHRFTICEHIGVSNIMNVIRAGRIDAHETLINAHEHCPSAVPQWQYIQSVRIREEMKQAILAAVPYFLGYTKKVGGKYIITTDSPETWPARSYGILWPISVCGRMSSVDDNTRQYCIRCFDEIGRRMGIQQALLLRRELETLGGGWGEREASRVL